MEERTDGVKSLSDIVKEKNKENPLQAKSILNLILISSLEVKNEKIDKRAYWGGSLTPQNRASLTHRLRVGTLVSDYENEEGDSKPGERPNCRCTVYFK